MRKSMPCLRWCVTAVCLALPVAGCAPAVAPRISQPSSAPATAAPNQPEAATPTAQPTDLGPAPTDLHHMDWNSVRIPGAFCDIPGLVAFNGHTATAVSRSFGRVQVSQSDVVYGDVDGDGRPEAALIVECDNGGDTAAGQLAFAAIAFTSHQGRLVVLGTVAPQERPSDGVHATLLADVRLLPGKVVADEHWYRSNDSTCCPSGSAVTTWTLHAGQLVPGTPDITS